MTALSSLRSDLPSELRRVIEKMTAPRSENRFRSAAEVAEALAPFCQTVQGATHPMPAKTPADKPPQTEAQVPPVMRHLDSVLPPETVRGLRSPGLPLARPGAGPRRSGSTRLATVQSYFRGARWKLLIGMAGLMVSVLLFGHLNTEESINSASDAVGASFAESSAVILPPPGLIAPSNADRPGVASRVPLRILYLVPATDLWWPEIAPFYQLHNSGTIKLTLTSWTNSSVSIHANGEPTEIPLLLSDANAADYDALIVGGGRGLVKLTENSEESRDAERLIRKMLDDGKIVSAFSVGPDVLAKMGLLKGVTATGHALIHKDVHARYGVTLTDSEVERSGQIITGRDPDTLPQFTAELMRALEEGR